mgnify:CR=1 FL=1
MPLSIRNEKTEKLARDLAAESGETITGAITRALEECLDRLHHRANTQENLEEILKISKRCSAIPDKSQRSADGILGYDRFGVPG